MKVEKQTDLLAINYTATGGGTAHEHAMKQYARKYDKCLIKEADLPALMEDLDRESATWMEEHPRCKQSIIHLDTARSECFGTLYGWISINGNALFTIQRIQAILKADITFGEGCCEIEVAPEDMEKVEKESIIQAMRNANGDMFLAAEILGISFHSLREKIIKYNLPTLGLSFHPIEILKADTPNVT